MDAFGFRAGCGGIERPQVPHIALQSSGGFVPRFARVPKIVEFLPWNTFIPHIAEVLTGIARQTAPLFVVENAIGLISDDLSVFMRFAFLSLAIDGDSAGLVSRSTGTPDHVAAPNHI